jgi:DNA repair protein RecO (recombination protein O)
MADKLFKTKGIVLKAVKYGETSLIVTILTELFGVQSYLVNGVRSSSKKGSGKANLFQPSALLDLVVYHNELKQLNRIKEFRWSVLYNGILSDVSKNAVALFMVELLTRCLKQPESNASLFEFVEDCLLDLDNGDAVVSANLSLFFALHLAYFFGIAPQQMPSDIDPSTLYFDLQDSVFTNTKPFHPYFIEGKAAAITADLLLVRRPLELTEIKLNQDLRRQLLKVYEQYYAMHIQDFGVLKTIPVLSTLF